MIIHFSSGTFCPDAESTTLIYAALLGIFVWAAAAHYA
jgi:hypothetical protein